MQLQTQHRLTEAPAPATPSLSQHLRDLGTMSASRLCSPESWETFLSQDSTTLHTPQSTESWLLRTELATAALISAGMVAAYPTRTDNRTAARHTSIRRRIQARMARDPFTPLGRIQFAQGPTVCEIRYSSASVIDTGALHALI